MTVLSESLSESELRNVNLRIPISNEEESVNNGIFTTPTDIIPPSPLSISSVNFNDNVITLVEDEDENDNDRKKRRRSKSTSSITTVLFGKEHFMDNKDALAYISRMLSGVYCLLIIILAFGLEIVNIHVTEYWITPNIFATCMYSIAIIIFIFVDFFIIYPELYNFIISKILKKILKLSIETETKLLLTKASHNGEGCGSFYLRIGALFFGTLAIIFFGIEIYMCSQVEDCTSIEFANIILAMIFTLFQTHYVFCNSKVTYHCSGKLQWFIKVGIMHLLAVNLWTWWKYVLAKQSSASTASTLKKIIYDGKNIYLQLRDNNTLLNSEILSTTLKYGSSESSEEDYQDHLYKNSNNETSIHFSRIIFSKIKENDTKKNNWLFDQNIASQYDIFYDIITILITCVVEYSVIGAAIMFVTWLEFEHHESHSGHSDENDGTYRKKRKSHIKIDCSNSFAGLFLGILFLAGCLITVGIYYLFYSIGNTFEATKVYRITDLCLVSVITVMTFYGIFSMRQLQYSFHGKTLAGIVDDILLIVGLLGELIYCCLAFLLVSTTNGSEIQDMGGIGYRNVMMATFIIRIVQSLSQALYLFTASRLKMKSSESKYLKPGKQMMTFMLLANLALFLYYILEGLKTMITSNTLFNISAFKSIMYAVSPLVVFFRFHSSVIFAELWKHCYSTKIHSHGNSTRRSSTITRRVSYAHDVL
uniref:Otopetrin-2 n=1 Tax=Parastrongyloides trichosuri TaxID=131310 RepID=A0A0N4Z8X8_PARTI